MTRAEAGAHRDRSIRMAVVTSFLSKAGNILLQLLSIPLAVRVLGREEFGLYTTVTLTLSTVSLLQVGIGPALAHGLSKARAAGDREAQRELGSTAFFLMLAIALGVGVLMAGALAVVPLDRLYGENFAGKEPALRPALWVGLGLFLMLFVLNLTERIREGHLEVAANNVYGAAGNVLAAVLVAAGVWLMPEVWFLVVAVHGAMVVTKVWNTAALWKKHPLMVPSLRRFRPGVAGSLFSDGIAFSTCCMVAAIVEYNLCGWMIGKTGGPSEVALYGVLITVTVMQMGFVVMLSTPTWPAVAEALARDDRDWARKSAGKLYWYGMGFALCSAAGLVVLGPFLFPIWLGGEFSGIGRGLLACYGFYFVAHVWRHLNHAMMIGTGQVNKLVRVQLLESALVALLAWFAIREGGTAALLVVTGGLIFAMTGWVLPRWVMRGLAR